jgi:glutaredoxin 3
LRQRVYFSTSLTLFKNLSKFYKNNPSLRKGLVMSDIKLYTKTTCPYCHALKDLLSEKGLTYEEILLDDKPDLRIKLMEENNGWRTVPMLFINGQFLGGYTDFKKIVEEGELSKFL